MLNLRGRLRKLENKQLGTAAESEQTQRLQAQQHVCGMDRSRLLRSACRIEGHDHLSDSALRQAAVARVSHLKPTAREPLNHTSPLAPVDAAVGKPP
jgi:hypothetical protein